MPQDSHSHQMTWTEALFLIGTGLLAGMINTIAGGGSLLTLPLLRFMGLSAPEANASNRVARLIQNIFAIRGFNSKNVGVFPFAYWVAISASVGSILGTLIAVDISDKVFDKRLTRL